MSILTLLFGLVLQTGVISGQLRQADGTPAAGIRVVALEAAAIPVLIDGASMMGITQTDSNGRYRLENIVPGRYYIQAGPIGSPRFYPGTADLSAATVIPVSAGATIESLDFTFSVWSNILRTERIPGTGTTSNFRGSIRGMTGDSLKNITVVLTEIVTGNRHMTTTDSHGAFEFSKLPKGPASIETFSPVQSGYIGNGFEKLNLTVMLAAGETLSEDLQLRLVMGPEVVRRRPDLYAVPPPRLGGLASMSENMVWQTRRILYQIDPVYPRSLFDANVRETVVVQFRSDGEGKPLTVVTVSPASNPEIVRAVVEAVCQWRFQPQTRDGVPVSMQSNLTFVFPPD